MRSHYTLSAENQMGLEPMNMNVNLQLDGQMAPCSHITGL